MEANNEKKRGNPDKQPEQVKRAKKSVIFADDKSEEPPIASPTCPARAGPHDGKASPGEHPIAALPKCHLQSAGGGAGGGGSDSKKKRRKKKQGGEKKDGAAPAKKKRATGGPKGLGSHDVKVDGPPATPGDEDDNTPAAWEHNGILDNFCKHAGPLEVAQGMSERLGREEEANRQYVEELDKALSRK